MKKETYVYAVLVMVFSCISCSATLTHTDERPTTLTILPESPDTQTDPTGSFDYVSIAPHPRLLFSPEEEQLLKTNLQTNQDLRLVHNAIIAHCDIILTKDMLQYQLEGKRLLTVCREALTRILYLSYAYRMTDDNRYLVRAEQELNTVCNFPDWNPTHFLDVGELGVAVSIGYDWLHDKLSTATQENLRNTLKTKSIAPSRDGSLNWFLNNNTNWNQVCNAGQLFSALAIYDTDKKEAAEIIERTVQSIKHPLLAYGPDGNYSEGYTYWDYGTSFQVMLLAALDSAFGTDLGLHQTPGFMKSAEYMLYMAGPLRMCFNYSDCSSNETILIPMFWFARKSNTQSLLCVEKNKIAGGGSYASSAGKDRLLPLALVYGNMPTFDAIPFPDKKIWVGHGTTPVALVRSDWGTHSDKYFGIKGGKASTAHGHMDAGSFVYDFNGVRWAMDLGMQSYGPLEAIGLDLWNMTQDSQRWTVFRLNNKAHNTLTINNKDHLVNGSAQIVRVFEEDSYLAAELDLTPVFQGEVTSAHRQIGLISNNYLMVEDKIQTNHQPATIRWNMITPASVQFSSDGNTIILEKDGKRLHVGVDFPDQPFELKTWSTAPDNDYDEPNPGTVAVGFETTLPANGYYHIKVRMMQ